MRKLAVPIIALALTAVAAPAAQAGSTPKPLKVTVGDNFFKPSKKTILKGTKVTWIWRGAVEHNLTLVTAPKALPKKSYRNYTISDRTTGSASRTLRLTGKWFFVCTLHAGMEQTIKVAVPR